MASVSKNTAKKCPPIVWCVVSSTGRVDARSGETGESLARLTAKHWNEIYPAYAPHRVCKYTLAKAGSR